MFERLVEAGGDTPHLHLLLGKAYFALNQKERVRAELQQAASDNLPYAHYYLGILNRKVPDLESAAAEFQKEIEATGRQFLGI